MTTPVHRLIIENWRHTHRPSCECGEWVGIPVHSVTRAAAQHRRHRDAVMHPASPGIGDGPRPPTPTADLPEGLR